MVSYEYFMDEIAEWELPLLMNNIGYSYKNEWEIARNIMFTNLMPYMKRGNKRTAKEMFPLITDDDYKESQYELTQEITTKQVDTMRDIAKKISKTMNGKHS